MSDSLFVKNYVYKLFDSHSDITSESASQGLFDSLKKDFTMIGLKSY